MARLSAFRLRIGNTQGMTFRISPPRIAPPKASSAAPQAKSAPPSTAATLPGVAASDNPRPLPIASTPSIRSGAPSAAIVSITSMSPSRAADCGAAMSMTSPVAG